MFFGAFEHSLDTKNRLSIPSKFREVIEKSSNPTKVFITLGLDECLFLFSADQWERVVASFSSMPFTDEATRDFNRLFFHGTVDADLDAQGRILIPENLKVHAGLAKNVTLIGVNQYIELWDRDKWAQRKAKLSGKYEVLAQQLKPGH